MMYEIKYQVVKGDTIGEAKTILQKKYPRVKVVMYKRNINFNDISKEEREKIVRHFKIWFIDDGDKLMDLWEKKGNENDK